MTEDKVPKGNERRKGMANNGVIYGMGFIGAAIYFLQHATSFMTGVVGILKAIVWPAMLVYKALELLKM